MSEFPYEILKELYASREWWKMVHENHAKFAPLLREYLSTLPPEKVEELWSIGHGGMTREEYRQFKEDLIKLRDYYAGVRSQEIEDAIERILDEGDKK